MLRKKNLVELDLAKDTIQKNDLVQEMSAKKMLEKDIFHHLHHQVFFFAFLSFFHVAIIIIICVAIGGQGVMVMKKNLVELDLAKDTIQKNNLVQEMSAKKMLEKDIFHHLHHQVLFVLHFVILSCCNYHHYMCCNWCRGLQSLQRYPVFNFFPSDFKNVVGCLFFLVCSSRR
jgi:hypothetical protein